MKFGASLLHTKHGNDNLQTFTQKHRGFMGLAANRRVLLKIDIHEADERDPGPYGLSFRNQ